MNNLKVTSDKNLIERINELKEEKNAVVLVHNYQRPEIYEVADFMGDSLDLSRRAAETEKDTIVFCGVKFMAETAKILSPEKKVLLPAYTAGCPMANMVNANDLRDFKKQHPNAQVVTYVNTNADVKAESDACCTSANAVDIVNGMEADEIIFAPDKNLAAYVQAKTDKKIFPWNGYCHVHERIDPEDVMKAKEIHKDAVFIAHPECPEDVLEHADYVFSTGGMVNFAKENYGKKIILGTEVHMRNRLIRDNPNNQYFNVGHDCHNMAKTNLQTVLDALEKSQYEINIPEDIRIKSKKALDRMVR